MGGGLSGGGGGGAASHALLPGWTIPHWQVPDEVKLPKTLTLVYHLPIELHTMAERLQATLAAEGCELTIIFHNAKNWDDTTLQAHADLMMGDRSIGEARRRHPRAPRST
ncbi:hypothetical protein PV939_12080, partial [Ligilactobacillus salivarius]|nr:hypothetical protein [Ligilactobacillus salivarius]